MRRQNKLNKNLKSRIWGLPLTLFIVIVSLVFVSFIISNMHISSSSQSQSKFLSSKIQNNIGKILMEKNENENENENENKVLLSSQKNINTNIQTNVITTANSKLKIGFAITITKDGNFQDGAAVLAYSIYDAFKDEQISASLIAFVHPNVTTSRSVLTQLGYHVIECPTPINVDKIKFKFLREKINKNGCCGASELIKLSSYRLTQYTKIVHLDADVLVLNPFTNILLQKRSLIYTTDPNMASHKGEDKMPVQGGFLVLEPSEEDYTNIINVMMTTEFRKGSAWNGTKIGWFWGGMTVQGVLPYYYRKVSNPDRMVKLDRCYYNTMADTPACSIQKVEDLTSAHFTICQKPWGCFNNPVSRLCGDLHHRWFKLRKEAEKFYSLPSIPQACPKGGHKWYKPMQLANAVMPSTQTLFVPDDSPDIFLPIKEALFDD